MRPTHVLLAAAMLAALGATGGCKREQAGEDSAGRAAGEATAPAEGQAAAPEVVVPSEPASTAPAVVTMRYDCTGGAVVEILNTDSARVTMADGRVVEVPLVAGSSPPAYVGEAVAFAVGSSGGQLSQDEGEPLQCKPA